MPVPRSWMREPDVQKQYPEVMDEGEGLEVSDDIPNDGVQFHPVGSRRRHEKKIVDALLDIVKTDEGKNALKSAYSWTALVRKDDEFLRSVPPGSPGGGHQGRTASGKKINFPPAA